VHKVSSRELGQHYRFKLGLVATWSVATALCVCSEGAFSDYVNYIAAMSDITQILQQIESGNRKASSELLPIVYDELRKLAAARMANERPDHTLQPTALVHEAYVRLVDVQQAQHWDSRGHFFSAAAEAMRRILIESARQKSAEKRGGDRLRVEIDADIAQTMAAGPDHLLEVSEALDRLAELEPEAAELVKLRLFAGLSVTESGKMLGLGRRKAYETWEFAEAWFAARLDPSNQ
jgi:RNA polymerase sigma factor (TIGR02999 family)